MAWVEQPPDDPADGEEGGVLLDEEGGIKASDLYDPATGKALLIPGVPINPPPPAPDKIRCGLIDSGVIPDHPQLRNLIVAMKDFTGDDPIDRIGHGTLVALRLVESNHTALREIAAADAELAAGLAGSPAIVSAKVTGPTGRIEQAHVIAAIHWMASQGVRVINMSLGFLGKRERYTGLCDVIARHDGIMFCAAVGNFGPDVPVYPAACELPNLMSVGAVMDGQPWARSGRGDVVAEGRVRVGPEYLYHYEEAQQLARAGAHDRARESYRASLAAEPNAPAFFGLAVLDLNAGNPDGAYAALAQARELAPDNADIEVHLGAARLMQQRPAEARTHLDRAIALDPNNVRARTNRAIVLIRLGEPARALDDLLAARPLAVDTSRIDAMIADLRRRPGLPSTGEGDPNRESGAQ
jgi:hypothetical protein